MKKNSFHFPKDKINFYTQFALFIIVPFCVTYAHLLRHMDSDCGRQIAQNVRNYKEES